MKIREVFEYVDEIMESVFSEKVKLRWINQIEAELQTDVLLIAADGIVPYTENDLDAELLAPPPYDELYTEYLQYRICLAQEEPERANNKAQTYNRIYTEYQIYIAQTANPGNGMAERMQYYLSAYQIALKHGYTGSEAEWLASLHGRNGNSVKMEYDEDTKTLNITVSEMAEGGGSVVLDKTLTQEGAAADSKAVGDAIEEVRGLIESAEDGEDGVGVKSVVQTKTSTVDGGENQWTMTLTNNETAVLTVRNGNTGAQGTGIAAIWYDSESGTWHWKDDFFFNDNPFEGPDIYSKDEIDTMFGSYVNDIAEIVGGDA